MRLRRFVSGLSRTALAGVGVVTGVALVATQFSSGSAGAATTDVVATGPGEGGGPRVRTFGPTGVDGGVNYYAAGTPIGGTNVAVADVTGDGKPELITGTGPGVDAEVQVWNADGKTLVATVHPFPGFNGGVNVAAANVDETPVAEIVVGAGPGGGPHVKVFRLLANALTESYGFFAYVENFTGGVNVAAAGGRIITGAGAGGGPHVRVWQIFAGQPSILSEWFAFSDFSGGVRVAAGAVRQDNTIDVVTAPGPGNITPNVTLWDLQGVQGPSFEPYPGFKGGVYVGVASGKRLLTGAGAGGAPHVKIVEFANEGFTTKASWYAYSADFKGGVKVAGFPAPPASSGTTTTTAAGCATLELPGIGCLGGASAEPAPTTTTAKPAATTTTVKPTTTTIDPKDTTTTSAPAVTTTTAAPGGLLGLPIPIP